MSPDRALLLILTPLQASIAVSALKDLDISEYDLLFFTRYRTKEVVTAFRELQRCAGNAALLSTKHRRPDVAVQFMFWVRARRKLLRWKKIYGHTIFASVDTPFVRGLALRTQATLVTIDDGVANVQQDSSYFNERTTKRGKFQRDLFGSQSLAAMKKRINTHYTIFPEFQNIVDGNRIRVASSWKLTPPTPPGRGELTFAIGSAETLWLDSSQIQALRQYLRSCDVDYYIPHPMQEISLLPEVPEVNKGGLLGEEAIINIAGDNKIHLIGPMSTLFLTLRAHSQKRTLIVPRGHEKYIELGERLGCQIVRLGQSFQHQLYTGG